jgi:MFS family permease
LSLHAPSRSALTRTPLAESYGAAVALALLALCPFIVLTTATALFRPDLLRDLHTSAFGEQLAAGLSNAGYAFGAVAAAYLVQRFPSRRVYIVCECGFVAGSLVALAATNIETFTAGRVLQGLATGMLLVAALPPLVTKHGAEKLPATAAFVNLGLFGMVTLGPLVGGIFGSLHQWRPLFAAVAVVGIAAVVLALLSFEENEPPRPDRPIDRSGFLLAIAATFLPFFGVSWLSRGGFSSPEFLVPVAAGVVAVAVLVVVQYRKRDALMPVRPISHTLPVTGIAGAMVVGASFTTLIELLEVALVKGAHDSPVRSGLLLASQLIGIAAAALLFARLLPTNWMPLLALSGLVVVALGALLLAVALTASRTTTIVPIAGALLGFGAGAGVAPGLFMAGLSVESTRLGPTFALVELLRSEAAFLLGPILLAYAMTASSLQHGFRVATWIVFGLTAFATLAVVGLYLLGGARLHEPDLEGWIEREETAYDSPPLANRVREPR